MEHTSFALRETLENAFLAGLLLTGSVERAETAIFRSVDMSCPDDLFGEVLFRRVIHHSIEQQPEVSERRQWELDRAASILPFELQCVLGLPPDLRHCFVLRLLTRLPREVCAWLLHLDIPQVNQRTCAAMLQLSAIQKNKFQFSETASSKNLPRNASNSLSFQHLLPTA